MANENTALLTIHDNLSKLLRDKVKALPRNFNETRFLQNCMVVLRDTQDIQNMTPISVARTMLKGAFLGLDFFNKECYAIPYRKNVGTKEAPKYVKELQFQTDYKGEIKLAKKYSLKKIHDIYAKIVRDGDSFEEIVKEGRQYINFEPKPFSNREVLGVFAVCLYEDGSMIYDIMTTEEIEKVRTTYSKVPNGNAWKVSWGEMAKKSVLRRLCKLIELEFDSIEQAEEYKESGDVNFTEIAQAELAEPINMPKSIDEPEWVPLKENDVKPTAKDNIAQKENPPSADGSIPFGHHRKERP